MTRHSVLEGKGLLSTSLVAGVQCQKPITCIPPDPTQAFTCTTGDVQLFSGTDTSDSEGVLNYCINGRWTPFCTLDRVTATVACSQLGYTDYSCKSLSLISRNSFYFIYYFSYLSLSNVHTNCCCLILLLSLSLPLMYAVYSLSFSLSPSLSLHVSPPPGAGIITDNRFRPTTNMSSFQNITCQGGETTLRDCVVYSDCISTCAVPYSIRCYGNNTKPHPSLLRSMLFPF